MKPPTPKLIVAPEVPARCFAALTASDSARRPAIRNRVGDSVGDPEAEKPHRDGADQNNFSHHRFYCASRMTGITADLA
jgi:hypothetical protein